MKELCFYLRRMLYSNIHGFIVIMQNSSIDAVVVANVVLRKYQLKSWQHGSLFAEQTWKKEHLIDIDIFRYI